MALKLTSSGSTFLLKSVGVLIEAALGSVFDDPNILVELSKSVELRDLVASGAVVVNDGSTDLSPSGGLQYLTTLWTQGGNGFAVRPPAALSTGILYGGNLSVNAGDNTKFDLSAGYGIIVNNVSDPEKPTIRFVEWPDMVGVSDPHIAVSVETYICVDENGDLAFHTMEPTPEDRRDHIHIGWTAHPDHATLEDAYTEPYLAFDALCQLGDFLDGFGAFNIDGNVYAADANLKISRSAGITFDNGVNYRSSAENPNRLETPLESPVAEIWYFYRDPGDPSGWKNDLPVVADVDPEHWDDGTGVLASVPAGKFTIQMISFYAPWEATDIQYGQEVYDTIELALAAIPPSPVLNPWNSWDTLRGWMVLKQGATDLTDLAQARFITITRFGMIQSAGGGSVLGEINTASNQGLSGQGLYLAKSGVDLQFKNIRAASPKITVANNAGQKAVDVDLGPHAPTHENGGADQMSVAGLSGLLGTPQTPVAHAITHQNGGADQMSVAGLTGLLGTPQTPTAHKDSHVSGGDAFLSTDFLDAVVRRLRETSGPTDLRIGAVADGEYLVRSGTNLVGATPSGVVFGTQAQYASSDVQSDYTGSVAYQQKVRLTTPSLPAGTYRIGWSYELAMSNLADYAQGRVQINDTWTIHEVLTEMKDSGNWFAFGGFFNMPLSGVQNIDLDYATSNWYQTVSIRRARLEIWRIS